MFSHDVCISDNIFCWNDSVGEPLCLIFRLVTTHEGVGEFMIMTINCFILTLLCLFSATALGNGVYFAVNTQYSDQGTYSPTDSSGHKRMYRCLVLTGDYCNGNSSMRVPPAKQGHILYDSVTNNTANPIMFVIFHDCQAYPEHIITYQ